MQPNLQVDLEWVLRDRLGVSKSDLVAFCQRRQIVELAFFGSVLRDDFRPDSDVDVLVEFAPNYALTWSDLLDIPEELGQLFGRKVDMAQKKLLKNPFSRAEILKTSQVIYAAERS